jgi:glycine/serine hydroxymethyltransferase
MVPGGLRMGSPALTSRGFVESDFDQVADFVDRAIKIAGGLVGVVGVWEHSGIACVFGPLDFL